MKFLILMAACCFTGTLLPAQGMDASLKTIQQQLSSGQFNTTAVLTNPSYMKLHSLAEFRELIKRNAKQGKITLTSSNEPGIPLTIKGSMNDKDGKAVANTLVYVYHTDNKGWYSDTAGHVSGMEGDRQHARLFGYFKINNDGSFEFNTIQPQGYPNSTLPQHIHFEVFRENGEALLITELLFEEDPRLNNTMRERMLSEGAFIAPNSGTKNMHVCIYALRLK